MLGYVDFLRDHNWCSSQTKILICLKITENLNFIELWWLFGTTRIICKMFCVNTVLGLGEWKALRTQSCKNASVFPHIIINSCNFIEITGSREFYSVKSGKSVRNWLDPPWCQTPQIGSELLWLPCFIRLRNSSQGSSGRVTVHLYWRLTSTLPFLVCFQTNCIDQESQMGWLGIWSLVKACHFHAQNHFCSRCYHQ